MSVTYILLYIMIAILVGVMIVLWKGLSKLKAQYPYLQVWIDEAINLAEQLFPETGSGPDKKKWAISWIIKKFGYKGSEELLADSIDKAVSNINVLYSESVKEMSAELPNDLNYR